MEKLVKQRVTDFIETTGMSLLAFSRSIGMSQSTLNQQLMGRNGKEIGLSLTTVTLILNAYPDLSAEWLLRGEGDMMRKPERENVTADTYIIDALKDHIGTLKEENRRLYAMLQSEATQKNPQVSVVGAVDK